jgi:ParB family chromosome partitioning protein
MSFQEVELKKVKPNRLNPRLEFRKEALDELADSVEKTGLVQPIVVRPSQGGYEVVVGERRYRASQQAKLDKVPAIVREYADDQVIELNLIENVQREDLTAVEKGNCIKQLVERYPSKYSSHSAVAAAIGVSASSVEKWLLLVNTMAPSVQRMVAPETPSRAVPKGRIDWRTASELAHKVKEKPKQIEVAKTLVQRNIRGTAARKVIQEVARNPQKPIEESIRKVTEAPASIPFMPEHVPPIRKGVKTQTSRKSIDPRIRVGAKIAAYTKFAELRVIDISRKKLGDFTDEDAKREGGYTLEEFRAVWKKLHGEWNSNETVNVIRFKVDKLTV